MKKGYGLIVDVVNVSGLAGFQVVPMRWEVERTFAWMNRLSAPMVETAQ